MFSSQTDWDWAWALPMLPQQHSISRIDAAATNTAVAADPKEFLINTIFRFRI